MTGSGSFAAAGSAGRAADGSVGGGGTGAENAGACSSGMPRAGAVAPRSSAASRTSTWRNCPRMPMVFTSAAMAMIGKASSSKPSTTKNTSMKTTSPEVVMLTKRRPGRKHHDARAPRRRPGAGRSGMNARSATDHLGGTAPGTRGAEARILHGACVLKPARTSIYLRIRRLRTKGRHGPAERSPGAA